MNLLDERRRGGEEREREGEREGERGTGGREDRFGRRPHTTSGVEERGYR